MQEINSLIVTYRGRTVGDLVALKNGEIAFQYDDEWIESGFPVSPFSLPLVKKTFINQKKTFGGLYGVFWDSLPDGWGELLISRMLSNRGISYDRLSPLEKLSIVRADGLGALQYEPVEVLPSADANATLDELATDARKLLEHHAESDLDALYRAGGSSGGARPKAHLTYDGAEWIVKFPCLIDPQEIGEQEYRANLLAAKCGIRVNECTLFPSKLCKGYFGAKRFDRDGGNKIHMISLSSLLETTHRLPNLDYGHLFQVIQAISVDPKDDLYEAFRRACFNVFYKNRDDHGKNFAFLYDENKKGYRLSPAYDLTSLPDKPEHEMTVHGAGCPDESDLIALAKDFRLSQKKCREILKCTKDVLLLK